MLGKRAAGGAAQRAWQLPRWCLQSVRRASGTADNGSDGGGATGAGAAAQGGTRVFTTPIFYVNAVPHIGHMYSAVLTDAMVRWERMKGHRVLFSTGTDEHGGKVLAAAEAAGLAPQAYCDGVSASFRALFERAAVAFDDFVRTTEPRHADVVRHVWLRLFERGHVYKGEYVGWYCVSDEEFLTPAQVVPATPDASGGDGGMVSASTGNRVVEMREENYMFRLSAFAEPLREWLDGAPDAVQPRNRVASVRSLVEGDLDDLSISRHRRKQPWGIEVPGDPDHTVYVWLDALVNYLTVAGYPWVDGSAAAGAAAPTLDTHVVGKDIVKFHCVYWPAILMALGLPPPRRVLAHGHWTMGKGKMSKSKGNVVDPGEMVERYGVDPFRYFLLSGGRIDADNDFSEAKVESAVNELANTMGNLQLRSTSPRICPGGRLPARADALEHGGLTDADRAMAAAIEAVGPRVADLYDGGHFARGLEEVMLVAHRANQHFDHAKPWELAKAVRSGGGGGGGDDNADSSVTAAARLATVTYLSVEAVRVAAVALLPVCPTLAASLLTRLGCDAAAATRADLAFGGCDANAFAGDRTPLFPKFSGG